MTSRILHIVSSGNSREAHASLEIFLRTGVAAPRCDVSLRLLAARSIWVRPESHFLLYEAPQTGEPVWLDDQEITYQRAGNDRHEMRNGLYRNMEAQCVWQLVKHDRQNQNECRAQKRSHDRSKTADNYHEKELERSIDIQRQGLARAQMDEGPERAGDTNDERRDRERRQLRVQRANADDLSGDVHVANRHPLTANHAARQVFRQQRP